MSKRTPFYDLHIKANGKMVDFAGWEMPLHYGSQIEEHAQVRNQVGMFDVSHMGIVDLQGKDTEAFLHYLLANNVSRLIVGKALYTCMLNEQGGVLDDLIVYKLAENHFRLVINAGTRDKDLAWMKQQASSFQVSFNERLDLAMLAIQGPQAKQKLKSWLPQEAANQLEQLKPFHFMLCKELFIARTGYTGEDGFEVIFPAKEAETLWQTCLQLGISPCGLGARDTLRLEAGLNLYGLDMDETVTPLEANLAWTVAFEPKDRNFIGRLALEKQLTAGVKQTLVGLVLLGPGVIRHHQTVLFNSEEKGIVTSGGYSPTLKKSIALARLPSLQVNAQNCFVEIRNKPISAQIIKPPFVRHGKQVFQS